MIIRTHPDRLELVTQPDHARLAADLLAAWRADGLPDRPTRDALLFATREHDRGWTPIDAAPLRNPADGRPFDFVAAPDPVKHALWPRAVASIGAESPYAAALVAEHAYTVYDRFRPEPSWTAFFESMARERDAWLARSGGSRAHLDRDYRLLRIADLLSLAFCSAWREPIGAAGVRLILASDALVVSPDPFDGVIVPLRVPMRIIPNRPYASDEDLHAIVEAAPVVPLTGRARGAA